MKKIIALLIACVASVLTVAGCNTRSATASPAQPSNYDNNGAWCWFNDPRAIELGGKTTFSSMTNTGQAQLTQTDANGVIATFTVATGERVDDHSVPSVTNLPDGRLIVFWTQHSVKGVPVRYRVSRYANEITNWGPTHMLPTQINGQSPTNSEYSYPDPVVNPADGRLYLFWRAGIRPGPLAITWTSLSDLTHWEPAHVLMQGVSPQRPYWQLDYDGHGGINIAITDGSPNETVNNVYFVNLHRASNGRLGLFTTQGTKYNAKLRHYVSNGPWTVHTYNLDVVQHASADYNGWLWDLAHTSQGYPIIATVGLPNQNHGYARYVTWTPATGWVNRLVTDMGGTIATPTREPNYSPGMAIDHANPGSIYISKMSADGHREISQYVTTNAGRTWTITPVTQDSTVDNVRPVMPRGATGGINSILFMSGTYVHWTDYHTEIAGN